MKTKANEAASNPSSPALLPSRADTPIPQPLPHLGGRGEYQKKGCFEWRCHSKHPFFLVSISGKRHENGHLSDPEPLKGEGENSEKNMINP
jgi:hypothetical protein